MFCGLLAQQIFKLFFIFTLLQSQSWSSILWFKYTPAFCIGNLGRQRWGISSDWSWYVPQINSKWNFLLICLEYRHRGCYGKNTLCFPILVNWMFRIGNPPPPQHSWHFLMLVSHQWNFRQNQAQYMQVQKRKKHFYRLYNEMVWATTTSSNCYL